jgi:hypothetical protein
VLVMIRRFLLVVLSTARSTAAPLWRTFVAVQTLVAEAIGEHQVLKRADCPNAAQAHQ